MHGLGVQLLGNTTVSPLLHLVRVSALDHMPQNQVSERFFVGKFVKRAGVRVVLSFSKCQY